MALPKRRHSKTRQAKRRTNWKPMKATSSACSNCGAAKRPHRVCSACGHYGGREVQIADLD
ncbi:MAG: 50S ribosomal protein L32 [Candidatus Eisenbacteria bacterium]|uniref:Large ribosomal subunit protein bL32 n=1 Tax=Eiseniibacteriota bacterium TaxID=2212470 RepID=A0A7Y2E9P1_UNCEI|nr:50S ribosomal protein L32 [Candidatus Eisenbacteria bacterium]